MISHTRKWPLILELPRQGDYSDFIKQKLLFRTIRIKGFRTLFPSSITF